MSASSLRRFGALLTVSMLLAAPAARADQTDKQLGPLFADLKAAASAEAAAPIEEKIWALWLQSGNDAVDALMAQGVAAMSAGDLDAALALFSRIVAQAPDFAEGWNKRATVLFLLGRFADSIADIGRVLALEPRHFGALAGLGLCNAQLDREQAALDAFERALALDPHLTGAAHNAAALKLSIARHAI